MKKSFSDRDTPDDLVEQESCGFIDILLEQRGKIHGDIEENSRIIQSFFKTMKTAKNFDSLSDTESFCLYQILGKISRALSGDLTHQL
jgi:hypothetical protein